MLASRLSPTLTLRPLEPTDGPALYHAIDANRAHLARWLPWAASETLAEAERFVGEQCELISARRGLEVLILENDRIAGAMGLVRMDIPNRASEIGYWLTEAAQGRGTMTAAVAALVEHAFADWDLHRLEIRAATDNRASRGVPERLGFRQEGIVRDAERIGERYLDLVIYGLLAGEQGRQQRVDSAPAQA